MSVRRHTRRHGESLLTRLHTSMDRRGRAVRAASNVAYGDPFISLTPHISYPLVYARLCVPDNTGLFPPLLCPFIHITVLPVVSSGDGCRFTIYMTTADVLPLDGATPSGNSHLVLLIRQRLHISIWDDCSEARIVQLLEIGCPIRECAHVDLAAAYCARTQLVCCIHGNALRRRDSWRKWIP